MILVIAKLRVATGEMERMLSRVEQLARHSRSERGCVEYTYLRSPEEDDLIVFVERWQDRESLAAHAASSTMAAYRGATRDIVLERSLLTFDAKEIVP